MNPQTPSIPKQVELEERAARVLLETEKMLDLFGPRLAGSQSCQNSAAYLRDRLNQVCGNAQMEFFQTHPAAFMGFYKVNTLIYLACLACLYLNSPFLAVVGFCLIFFGGFSEFGFYRELYDPLFPARSCANVWAKLEPTETAAQQVIVSGHHDSAQELSLLKHWQKLYPLKILVPDIVLTVGLLFSIYWGLDLATGAGTPGFAPILIGFLTLGTLAVLSKFFLVSQKVSPGAGDNLVACTMLLELAHQFAQESGRPGDGHSALRHTRLIFASFDAEESGLRGSRAFARRHQAELHSLPTTVLNIDSIYSVKDLQFMLSDLNGTVQLSQEVAGRCQQLAQQAGYPSRLTRMAFGGGATDATELARQGVKATTMLAMPTELIRDGLVYHTLRDTVEAIEPQAVQACLGVAADFIRDADEKTLHYSEN